MDQSCVQHTNLCSLIHINMLITKAEPGHMGESHCTCMELIMVLSANTVAESLSVDWLSNVPCVSISNTATCEMKQMKTLTSAARWS